MSPFILRGKAYPRSPCAFGSFDGKFASVPRREPPNHQTSFEIASRLKRPTHPKVAGFRHLICTQPHWSSVWDASFPYLGWTRPEPLSGPLRSWWMHLMQCSGFVALTPIDIPRIHRLPFVVLPLQGGPLGTKHLRALCASLGEDCLPTSTVLRRAAVQGLSPPTAEHHPSPRGLVSNPWQRALDCLARTPDGVRPRLVRPRGPDLRPTG